MTEGDLAFIPDPFLPVNNLYLTFQGEGVRVGIPSIFLRLQGCNFRCPWCDQPEALEMGEADKVPISEVFDSLLKYFQTYNCKEVVITGGEPTIWWKPLTSLLRRFQWLKDKWMFTFETNGSIDPGEYLKNTDMVFWSISPKLSSYALKGNPLAGQPAWWLKERPHKERHQIKIVLENESSLEIAKSFKQQGFNVVCQPCEPLHQKEYVNMDHMLKREIMAKLNQSWALRCVQSGLRFIPQTHKMSDMP